MNIINEEELRITANNVRKDVVRMVGIARSGHLVSSLSIVDVLSVLYWKVMKVSPQEPRMASRDRFILSKGHGCPALYAVLARRGFFSREELWNYRRLGAMLQGHPETPRTPGIDAPSGSLGMGLGVGNGMALFLKREQLPSRVFCLVGDGEVQEGSVWESAMTSSHFGLDNVVLIIDRNMRQSEGVTSEIREVEPLEDKFRSFGWETTSVDGHDLKALTDALDMSHKGRPLAVVARTVPGKGVSFMEKESEKELPHLSRLVIDKALRELNAREEKDGDS